MRFEMGGKAVTDAPDRNPERESPEPGRDKHPIIQNFEFAPRSIDSTGAIRERHFAWACFYQHPLKGRMSLLQQAQFFTTVNDLEHLPMLGLPEIAFAGRSNAGKSTAINTLCHQKRLAFASKTPGRTQHINFFAVGTHPEDETLPAAFLVDLPGYGYANVARSAKKHWEELLARYIRQRGALTGLVLIMDARRPMTDLDCALIEWFAPTAKPIHVLLTKSDKLNRSEASAALKSTSGALSTYGAQHTSQLFSSLRRVGVEAAQARILELLGISEGNNEVVASQKKAPTQGE